MPFLNDSAALLPTRTNISPAAPEANEYFDPTGTLLVLQVEGRPSFSVAQSAGDATGFYSVGDRFEAHHDQAGYSFGTQRIVGIVHGGVGRGTIPTRKLSLRVFK
jgi:hypothetical protein